MIKTDFWALTGIRMPFGFALSEAIKGTMAPIEGKTGSVRFDPAPNGVSSQTWEVKCKMVKRSTSKR